MKTHNLLLLAINSIAYILLFIFYQKKKSTFDIGTVLLGAWVIGSIGSVYYYTFEGPSLSYDNITILPLIYLFVINYLLFSPFLKTNYNNVKTIKIYNLGNVFNGISIFFGIIGFPALLNLVIHLSSFSMEGAALAEMYSSEEDSASLLFLPYIKPFYSILRHFTVFIIFLFFYQLSKKKIRLLITLGLFLDILVFFLFSLLCGSRGGLVSLLLICAFYFLFMKSIMKPKIVKMITRGSILLCSCLLIGIAAISISRLTGMEERRGKDLLMDQWISQYAGEGIIRFDHAVWNLQNHLNGAQNFPYLISFKDPSIKDLEIFAGKAEYKIKEPITVFYTYVGDMVIDFGIIGSIFFVLLIYLCIRYFIEVKKHSISFYHLIILSFFFEYLSIGFTANIFRTYYSQLPIIETLLLLAFIYCFQKINEKRYLLSGNCHSSI